MYRAEDLRRFQMGMRSINRVLIQPPQPFPQKVKNARIRDACLKDARMRLLTDHVVEASVYQLSSICSSEMALLPCVVRQNSVFAAKPYASNNWKKNQSPPCDVRPDLPTVMIHCTNACNRYIANTDDQLTSGLCLVCNHRGIMVSCSPVQNINISGSFKAWSQRSTREDADLDRTY